MKEGAIEGRQSAHQFGHTMPPHVAHAVDDITVAKTSRIQPPRVAFGFDDDIECPARRPPQRAHLQGITSHSS